MMTPPPPPPQTPTAEVFRSLFVILFFFFWPLCYLSFFDLRILITPLVSSNSSVILCYLLSFLVFSNLCFASHELIFHSSYSVLCFPVCILFPCRWSNLSRPSLVSMSDIVQFVLVLNKKRK